MSESSDPLTGIDQYREEFYGRLFAGESQHCLGCDRFAKLHPRPLNSTMAKGLLWLVWKAGDDHDMWLNVPQEAPRFIVKTNQLSILKHWGLIEDRWNDDSTKRASGYWRATDKGRAFVSGDTKVISKALLYNDQCFGFTGPEITMSDALDTPFNYSEMMQDRSFRFEDLDTVSL